MQTPQSSCSIIPSLIISSSSQICTDALYCCNFRFTDSFPYLSCSIKSLFSTEKCIEEYYSRLFAFNDGNIDKSTITSLMGENLKFDEIPFRTYAENFKFSPISEVIVLLSILPSLNEISDCNILQYICRLKYCQIPQINFVLYLI